MISTGRDALRGHRNVDSIGQAVDGLGRMRRSLVDGNVVADNCDGVVELYMPVTDVDAGVRDFQGVAVVAYNNAGLFCCVIVNETMCEKGLCRTPFAWLHCYPYNGKRYGECQNVELYGTEKFHLRYSIVPLIVCVRFS